MMDRCSELFLYLGRAGAAGAGGAHAWAHFAPLKADPAVTAEMCRDVYHLMLDGELATSEEACLVFSVSGANLLPVCVEHSSRAQGAAAVRLFEDNSAETCKKLLLAPRGAERAGLAVVSPSEPGRPYITYAGRSSDPAWKAARALADMELHVQERAHVVSTKALPRREPRGEI